ncbi:unnamed protein product [Darwinula stevensoni]|uniref:Protein Wnt n=1 Tax=Darwinula stevensoni TaxID=69355 RepID=A0A7R8XC14_9CRUS|nr:unnamed protein product [Darwinula stevensoni]CAG0887227.1 unnamed protein product [Darwinula stevensoni]
MCWFLGQLQLSTAVNPRVYCNHIPGLVRRQRRLCHKYADAMPSVGRGAGIGVAECRFQFRHQRWNCSTVATDASVFGKTILRRSSREAAFVYAISSAGVVYSVSRSCSKGDLAHCRCDPRRTGKHRDTRGEFAWGGCSDDVRFGSLFGRKFVDAREKKVRDARALMNLHNNRAGRKAVRKHMQLECKCHGVSGACTVRTCWASVMDFRSIGSYLKRKYDAATLVTMDQSGRDLVAAVGDHKPPTRGDLVYLEASPDYCLLDQQVGSLGTAGRECNRTSPGTDGCDILCCGRGYDTARVLVTKKCHCKFIWCCEVECQDCREWRDVYTCKAPRRDST